MYVPESPSLPDYLNPMEILSMGLALHGRKPADTRGHCLRWLERFGAKGCLLAWLPVVGDPLCGAAGWLNLPFWPSVFYMAIGKFARYVTMTLGLLWGWPIFFGA